MSERSVDSFFLTTFAVLVVGILFGLSRLRPAPAIACSVDLGEPEPTDTAPAEANENVSMPPQPNNRGPSVGFQIRLAQAYYHQGIVNPGAHASMYLGEHGESVTVHFDDATRPVLSKINRTANPGGYARLVGGNARIRDWFQSHFAFGDVVEAEVIDRSNIVFHRKATVQ